MKTCLECGSDVWVESGVNTEDGKLVFTLWKGNFGSEVRRELYTMISQDMEVDDLNAVCARCGTSVVGHMTI